MKKGLVVSGMMVDVVVFVVRNGFAGVGWTPVKGLVGDSIHNEAGLGLALRLVGPSIHGGIRLGFELVVVGGSPHGEAEGSMSAKNGLDEERVAWVDRRLTLLTECPCSSCCDDIM